MALGKFFNLAASGNNCADLLCTQVIPKGIYEGVGGATKFITGYWMVRRSSVFEPLKYVSESNKA